MKQSLVPDQASYPWRSGPSVRAFGEKVGNRTPALRIIHRDDDAARLVQRQIEMPTGWRNAGAVDSDHISFRIDPAALLHNDLGIHFDAPLADQDFAGSTRGNAGLGEDLLEAYACCRFGH
jgi:hypothetical protein